MAEAAPTAAFLVIGNEILSGRTAERNIQVLAKRLRGRGVSLSEARVVPDVRDRVVGAVNELRATHDVLFTSGGIGPTHDDITTECVAEAFGVDVVRHEGAAELMRASYEATGREATESRMRMADVPQGAEAVTCAITPAPGYRIGNVYVLAGVPFIFESMLDEVEGSLPSGPAFVARTVTVNVGESVIADDLGALQDSHPDIDIGSYPQEDDGRYYVELVFGGRDQAQIDAAVGEMTAKLDSRGLSWSQA